MYVWQKAKYLHRNRVGVDLGGSLLALLGLAGWFFGKRLCARVGCDGKIDSGAGCVGMYNGGYADGVGWSGGLVRCM